MVVCVGGCPNLPRLPTTVTTTFTLTSSPELETTALHSSRQPGCPESCPGSVGGGGLRRLHRVLSRVSLTAHTFLQNSALPPPPPTPRDSTEARTLPFTSQEPCHASGNKFISAILMICFHSFLKNGCFSQLYSFWVIWELMGDECSEIKWDQKPSLSTQKCLS